MERTEKKVNRKKSFTVYIIECTDGSLYTGITNNLPRRMAQHHAGVASRYTRARGVRRLRYVEMVKTKSAALKREYAIKQMTRQTKLQLGCTY